MSSFSDMGNEDFARRPRQDTAPASRFPAPGPSGGVPAPAPAPAGGGAPNSITSGPSFGRTRAEASGAGPALGAPGSSREGMADTGSGNVAAFAQRQAATEAADRSPPPDPTPESVNATLNAMLEKQMQALEESYKGRVDSINQQQLSHMRGAANLASQAGLGWGGSFADAQRQVLADSQSFRRDAYNDYQAQRADIFGRQAGYEYDTAVREDERRYNENLQAGTLEADLFSQGRDLAERSKGNPFERDRDGVQIPYEYLTGEARGIIDGLAAAKDMDPAEYYAQEFDANRFDYDQAARAGTSQEQAEARANLTEMSNDFDELSRATQGNRGAWNYKEVYEEIDAVMKDLFDVGMSREEAEELLLSTGAVSAEDIQRAFEEEGF